MEESIRKGMKSLELNDRVADIPKTRLWWCEISVEGYETCSLQKYGLELALRKHFASCGDIISVCVIRNMKKGTLKRVAFLKISGEDAEKKALELDGTDVGGWYAIVKAAQWPKESFDPSHGRIMKSNPHTMMSVAGFDNRLPDIDIKIALSQVFSSCGEVTNVIVFTTSRQKAVVIIVGARCEENAMELNGHNVGGMNLVVKPLLQPVDENKRRRAARHTTGYMLPSRARELAMEMEKEKENAKKKKKMDKEEMVKMKKALFS